MREFQTRYEAAVPTLPVDAVERLVTAMARWAEVIELDRKLAALLDALEVLVPDTLGA